LTGPSGQPTDPPERPGARYFTIEGKAAPGLFVLGWLATIVGLGVSVVGFAGGATGAALVVLTVGLAVLSIGAVSLAGSQAMERRASGGHAYEGPSPVLVFAATVPIVYFALIVLGAPLAALGVDAPRPLVELLLVGIQAAAYAAIVRLVVVGTGALSWADMGFRHSAGRALGDLAWGAVFAGPAIAATVVVSGILIAIFQVAPEGPLPPTGEPSGLVLHLLAGAVLAPIGEEIIFRGVALTAWARTFGERSGILRSALFFALAHVILVGGATVGEAAGLTVVGFASRLPVALLLGWVFVRRRSIYAAIGLHAAFNAVLLIISEVAAGAVPEG
jgi:membrane protease YdiL (CAAX protease family)